MNKAAVVQAVLSSIIAVAQKYNVAVLGSVGTPKQKGPDRYHGRDVLFGSAALARKTETIVALSYHDEKDLKSPRVCWVMPRNSSPEKMFFDWVDGRFTQVEEPENAATVTTAEKTRHSSWKKDWVLKHRDVTNVFVPFAMF